MRIVTMLVLGSCLYAAAVAGTVLQPRAASDSDQVTSSSDHEKPDAAPTNKLTSALPVTARHVGTWKGIYRRYDSDGALTGEFSSLVEISYDDQAGYRQKNTYSRDGEVFQVIDSNGTVVDDRLVFDSGRVKGWVIDVAADDAQLSSMLHLGFVDGSGIYCYEVITLSPDATRRHRATQCFRDGDVISRTLIDEQRVGA